MCTSVATLVSAYVLTGNETYAQAIAGICPGRGIGIIDTLPPESNDEEARRNVASRQPMLWV